MSKDWYEEVQKRQSVLEAAHQQLHDVTLELVRSTEAVERLAEFASEMAERDEAHKEGMVNNFNRVMELLDELDAVHLSRNENVGDMEMWRGLCHSRAVQLNEAYEKIARLEDEVKFLQGTIDDMIVGESIK